MTTYTKTPTCPDSHACDSSAHLYRENGLRPDDEVLWHGQWVTTCPCRCHRIDGQRQNARHYIDEARERRRAAVVPEPSIEQLQDWSDNGGMEAVDGCGGIEDDGTCEHGAPSWMRALGLI